jgi:serine/threonine protein kinase
LEQNGLELRGYIASGGFSSVYTAHRTGTQQLFAVKISDVEHASGWEGEVQSLIKLYHSNIIQLYQIIRDDKFSYLVLENCPGGSLADRLHRTGPLGTREFRDIARQLLDALGKCHAEGIAHLDIKPSNILFAADGRIRLGDFGCSQGINQEELFSGSKPYMAPEVVCRMQGYDIFMADIWSLGVTFYFMAAGKLPWKNSSSDGIVGEIRLGSVTPLTGVDPMIVGLIEKMLRLEPSQRAPCSQLLAHIDAWIGSSPSTVSPMRMIVRHASFVPGKRGLTPSSSSGRLVLAKSFMESGEDLKRARSSGLLGPWTGHDGDAVEGGG